MKQQKNNISMKNLIITVSLLITSFGYGQLEDWNVFIKRMSDSLTSYSSEYINELPYIGIDSNNSLRIYDNMTFAELVIIFINEERSKNGLTPLVKDDELMKFAQKHSDWMTKTKKYQHSGENIAEVIMTGSSSNTPNYAIDARSCVRSWIHSTGHRKHLLNPNFTRIGSGFNENNIDGYFTVVFKR
jgi:uncharacterized protein YkwD